MNREFKFRVWDKGRKLFLSHFDGMKLDSEGILYDWLDKNTIIQQFTGLKDVNNKDIYEGDIVKHGTDGLWKIEWDKRFCSFVKNGTTDSQEGYNMTDYEDITEIVGNIFENK